MGDGPSFEGRDGRDPSFQGLGPDPAPTMVMVVRMPLSPFPSKRAGSSRQARTLCLVLLGTCLPWHWKVPIRVLGTYLIRNHITRSDASTLILRRSQLQVSL